MLTDDFGGLTASEQQKRLYFRLMRKLGYDGETARAKIREKYKIDSFANVSSEQLSEVINILKEKEKHEIYKSNNTLHKNRP